MEREWKERRKSLEGPGREIMSRASLEASGLVWKSLLEPIESKMIRKANLSKSGKSPISSELTKTKQRQK